MKNKKLICLLTICVVLITITSIHKEFENDTFFTIPTGNYILQNGIDEAEPFTWHENLKFTKLRWGFDIVVALIYNNFGFTGIYVFTVIMSGIIGATLFITLVKRKNSLIVSFALTVITMMFMSPFLKCRRSNSFIFTFYIRNVFDRNVT